MMQTERKVPFFCAGNADSIYIDILISLIPLTVWGVIAFGGQVAISAAVSAAAALAGECIARFLLKRRRTGGFTSAAVTGVILPLCFPPQVAPWIIAVGAFFAVLVFKYLLGEIRCGKIGLKVGDFLSPVAAAWCILRVLFPQTGEYTKSLVSEGSAASENILAVLRSGEVPSVSVGDMLLGRCSGTAGGVCALLIVFCGIYLIRQKAINWRVPAVFVGVAAIITLAFPLGVDRIGMMTGNLLSGSLFFGAVFAACLPGASPLTERGKMIYAAGCGILTVLFRYFGIFLEGVPFALLIMGVLSPLIDIFCAPRPFGYQKNKRK